MTETHSDIAPPEKPEVLLMKIELYALPPQIAAPEFEEEMFIKVQPSALPPYIAPALNSMSIKVEL